MKNEQTLKYLSNQLTEEERNAFEKELIDDPLLMEALEGLEEWHDQTNHSHEQLQDELDEKIENILRSINQVYVAA